MGRNHSIDAFAVGVTFAALQVNMIVAVSLIGSTAFLLSSVGVTSYYNEFYSAIEKSVYHRLSKLNNNYAEDICWLLSRAYLATFFEIIRCDYDFETAKKCIGALENFFAPQEIH